MSFRDLAEEYFRAFAFTISVVTFASSIVYADNLHALFSGILKDHVVNGIVDYASIKGDRRLDRYLEVLSKTEPTEITDDHERLAFWINAYNAFTVKLIVDHYPVKSIRDIHKGDLGPWDIVWITIRGRNYSLNDIEHEVIRKGFNDPRIHMALVCAAESCPPLRSEPYTGEKLDSQLQDNARKFLLDTTKNRYDEKSKTLYLSELFKWYGKDFVQEYGSAEKFALQVMGLADVRPYSVEYFPYNWNLNGH